MEQTRYSGQEIQQGKDTTIVENDQAAIGKLNRDSFIVYRSFHESIQALPDKDDRLSLYTAINEYALNGHEIELQPIPKAFFALIKPQLDANIKKYLNGKGGGRPSNQEPTRNPKESNQEPTGNQTESKPKRNVNDNVNDNANENDNVNKNENANASIEESAPDFFLEYGELEEKNPETISKFIKKYNPKFMDPYKDLWNLFAKKNGLPIVRSVRSKWEKLFIKRVSDPDFNLAEILSKADKSDFIKESDSKWFDFAWVIGEDDEGTPNFFKVIEGKYDNKKRKPIWI